MEKTNPVSSRSPPAAGFGEAAIVLEGSITAHTAAPIWRRALETLRHSSSGQPAIIDAEHLEHIDDVGIALLFDLATRQNASGASVEIRGLAPKFASLIEGYDPKELEQAARPVRPIPFFEQLGRATMREAGYVREVVDFAHDCTAAFVEAVWKRGVIRWGEVLDVATEAGANAVPIVLLVGGLMGLIVAFEVGQVARQFGAVIFVVNGVGIGILRELGPLMTAIVFAGRTGAAFAAQIGTQKVNEEVNAISTFGLDPVHFLVLPRLIAAALVLPLLVVMADIVGLFGGALVMVTFDVSFVQFYNQLISVVEIRDFVIGLVKAVAFGLTIAAIGCERGLATGAGATSVGLSATKAVVSSIIMIVVIDGVFAVLTN
jgi:phospholipid/cholesterol/gamma-HCH transport system permease protein